MKDSVFLQYTGCLYKLAYRDKILPEKDYNLVKKLKLLMFRGQEASSIL